MTTEIVPIPPRQLGRAGATTGTALPVVFLRSEDRGRRFWEFFTVNIRNKIPARLTSWPSRGFRIGANKKSCCSNRSSPMHVAGYIEQLGQAVSLKTLPGLYCAWSPDRDVFTYGARCCRCR
jgi:hypothetical protein